MAEKPEPQRLVELMAHKAGFPTEVTQEDDGSGFVVLMIATPVGEIEVTVQLEFAGSAIPEAGRPDKPVVSNSERTEWASPPRAPAGLAAYCSRCAASGVGVCDDYPDCPAGRAQQRTVERVANEWGIGGPDDKTHGRLP